MQSNKHKKLLAQISWDFAEKKQELFFSTTLAYLRYSLGKVSF